MTQTQETPYRRVIGDAPDCGPGEHDAARRFVAKIHRALEMQGWNETTRAWLNRLRVTWEARANGEDPRFEIVGTRAGRLPRDIENEIAKERKRIAAENNLKKKKRSPRYKKWKDEEYDDPVLREPHGPARGWGDSDQGEGEHTPEGGGKWRRNKNPDEEYFVSASDSRGHNVQIHLRVQPRHMTALQRLLSEGRFPFETLSDICRWCIDKGIDELNQRRPSATVGSVLVQARVLSEFLLSEKQQQDYEDALNEMRNTVTRYRNAGARGEAIRVVAQIKHGIEQMQEGYWKDKYLKNLHDEFGELLDSGSNPVSFVADEGELVTED